MGKESMMFGSESDEPPDIENKRELVSEICIKEPPKRLFFPKSLISNISQLSKHICFGKEDKQQLEQVAEKYHMLITPYYLSLIKDFNDINDPVRKQCVPAVEELAENPDEKIDPLGEEESSVTPYLVHRYPDRVLLLVTSKCFMYCRHCTRKRLWKKEHKDPSLSEINASLDYVKANPQIREIVVSGGDPLTLNSERLEIILDEISNISHIEAVRIGTRTPVVFPERINRSLCKILGKYNNLWINVQFNHPSEITKESAEACSQLQKCGIPLNNQSVLLKGINDSKEVMMELCHKLQKIRVRPYYIFQCDEVAGAKHFMTSALKGIEIIEKMRGHTSGMCIPTFVIDGPNGKGKIPLNPNYILSLSPQGITLRNYNNEIVEYANPCE